MSGSLPVEVAAEIVERRLDEFNVSLEKHVVCVTDGVAVMVKFGVYSMEYIWQHVMHCMESM